MYQVILVVCLLAGHTSAEQVKFYGLEQNPTLWVELLKIYLRAGDEVLRVVPRTHKQVRLLQEMEDEVDFWSRPYNINHDVDFRVPKDIKPYIKHLLGKHGISYQVIIEDVQRAVDKELESMVEQSRRKRSVDDAEEEEGFESENRRFLSQYNSHAKINEWLENIADYCGSRCDIHDIGRTGEGKLLRVIKIGGSRRRNRPKNIVWIDGGIHGREWISPATAINIISKLVLDYSSDRCTRHIVEAFDWYILPIANPDGYEYSRIRNRMWRKNRKVIEAPRRPWWSIYYYGNSQRYCYGVDLNRNFGFSWGEIGTSTNPCSDVYGGSNSFSEPESVAIRNFTKSIHGDKGNIKIFLSLHSYGQYWLYSWGYTRQLPEDFNVLDEVASEGARAIYMASNKRTRYIVGSTARTLYASSGGSDDWAKGELGVRYAFTLELPPSDVNAQGNGFLLPVSSIPSVVDDTWPGIKAMAATSLRKDRPKSHSRHLFCFKPSTSD